MQYRTLGKTGLNVSLASYGTGGQSQFGQKAGLEQKAQDDQKSDPEVGDGEAAEGCHTDDIVGPPVAPHGSKHAEGYRDQAGQQNGVAC